MARVPAALAKREELNCRRDDATKSRVRWLVEGYGMGAMPATMTGPWITVREMTSCASHPDTRPGIVYSIVVSLQRTSVGATLLFYGTDLFRLRVPDDL